MSKQGLPAIAPDATGPQQTTPGAAAVCCAPLNAEEAAELAPLFKAIADPVRLRLLSMIACHDNGQACVCDLTEAFELTGPTISHHLKVLKGAGLIESQRRGTWVYYWLNPTVLQRLSAILGPRLTATQPATDRAMAETGGMRPRQVSSVRWAR